MLIVHRLSEIDHPQIKCGNYEYTSNPIYLGNLSGNLFQIRILDVKQAKGKILKEDLEGVMKVISLNQ